jgi:hypothetical protein
MKGVPAFEVVSAPVEFEVVRPLDLVVRVRRPLKAHVETRLSDLLEVTLINNSDQRVEVSSPTLYGDAQLGVEMDGQLGGWAPRVSEQRTQEGMRKVLKPGERVPVLGKGEFANGLDGSWEYPQAETVRVRAVYRTSTWKAGAVIRSRWVTVRVER